MEFDDHDTASTHERARLSAYPAATVALCRTYNRYLAIFIAQSRYFALSRAMRRLQYVRGFTLGASPIAIARDALKLAPDALDTPLMQPSGLTPCIELTHQAYKRFSACCLTAYLAVLLSGAVSNPHKHNCSANCRRVLGRVYSFGIIPARLHSPLVPHARCRDSLAENCTRNDNLLRTPVVSHSCLRPHASAGCLSGHRLRRERQERHVRLIPSSSSAL